MILDNSKRMKKLDFNGNKAEILSVNKSSGNEKEIISSEKDRDKFFDALLNPPLPNENLRKA